MATTATVSAICFHSSSPYSFPNPRARPQLLVFSIRPSFSHHTLHATSTHCSTHSCRRRFYRCLSLDRADDTVLQAPMDTVEPRASPLRVVFAAGGTGGHVYPAIAIADEITRVEPGAQILFLGSEDGIEKKAVPSAGFAFESIPPFPLARPILSPANLLFPFSFAGAVFASWKRLREFRPQVVIGTGGHVSAPVCFAAAILGIDLFVQEQNSATGLANRALAPFTKKIFIAFNACIKYFPKEKCVVCGNPVRPSLLRFVSRAAARAHFFPAIGAKMGSSKKEPQVVLVLGGSSGAHAINIALLNMYHQMLLQHKNRYIIWQTGEDAINEMESLVKIHPRVFLTPFLDAIDLAYAAADIVVTRAGAMTCTEILTLGKPSILIPLSDAAEGHQTKNAYIMAEIAGSKVVMEDELDSSTLESAIDEILGNEQLMAEMAEKALSFSLPNASKTIAQSILSHARLSDRK